MSIIIFHLNDKNRELESKLRHIKLKLIYSLQLLCPLIRYKASAIDDESHDTLLAACLSGSFDVLCLIPIIKHTKDLPKLDHCGILMLH